ncbi:RNA methyltransferase [Bacillaceae bacterium SIJ1]|uniref:TrmH family RNA methyltransferase n=1 Tax=Litoribacterium kuwaitense TaxID=1398745 RepID=UPI0013EC3370|nr:RNA methyltransferase [Litoribacterium kuwaitense]NGP45001.1 RNA methyltransferase [Litoribacterium kuwaitense]
MKTIHSTQNSFVKQLKKLHKKKYRDQMSQFLIEGPHLFAEALSAGQVMPYLLVEEDKLQTFQPPKDSEVIICSEDVIRTLSQTESPQGIIAVCHILKPPMTDILQSNCSLALLDDIQDPGNLGTLIRTAEVLGMTAVVLGKHCADMYNSKAVRATQGALFHLPVIRDDLNGLVNKLAQANVPIFATAMDGLPLEKVQIERKYAVVFGNEGRGIDEHLLSAANERISIPMAGKTESLNVTVAAGIVMYGLQAKKNG